MMVNSWQGALEVPAGIHSGIGTPDLVRWQGKPLLEAVQQRAEIVNVWIQGVEPTVSIGKLNTLLTAQNPERPLEVTLELFDRPDSDLAVKHPRWPEQLWGIAGEISQRWPDGPFSITIRGDRGGQTAAPAVRPKQADAPKKAGMEEFNPGHGKHLLKRLFAERRKPLDILQKRGTTLSLRFVNLLHTPPIQPSDIPGFGQAHFLSFELPPSAVKAFLAGEPTVIRDNPLWVSLLQAGRDRYGGQAGEVLIGVDAFAPARNAMRRVTYAYTDMDFDGGKPRKKVQLDGPVDLAKIGLGSGQVSEEDLLLRLTSEQRDELERNRILFLSPGSPNPFSAEPGSLREQMILYRPPHESVRALVGQLRDKYAEELSRRGIPTSSVNDFLVEHFLFQVFILLRDHMQLTTIFRRWQTRLKQEAMPTEKEILALHLGGAMHFQSLLFLASRDLPGDAPLRLEGQDDTRVPVLAGSFKGIPFFVERFEPLMDHLRVTNEGEVELDAQYFTDLFGEYLAAESRTFLVEGIYHSLFPEAPDTPEAVTGQVSFETYRDLTSLHGLLSQLTEGDLEHLSALARARPPGEEAGELIWEELHRTLGKEEYRSLSGIAQAEGIVSRQNAAAWYNLGVARERQGDLPAAVEAYERAIKLNPEHANAWFFNVRRARQRLEQIPEDFKSADAFLEKYGKRLRDLNLLEVVDAFRGADRVLAFPDVSMTESVIAYPRATDSEWLNITEGRLKSDFVLTVPYPEEDHRVQPRSVVIQQEGMDIPKPSPAVPVLIFRSLEELQQRLTPGFVYAVAVNKNLAGQVIGPIVGILTFTDEQGRTLHAVFA